MSKDWPYAQMTQEAAKAGGPDKLLEKVKKAAYESGASDMKNELVVPLLATGIGLGAICAIGVKKIWTRIAEKKRSRLITEQEALEAEEFLKKKLTDTVNEIGLDNGGEVE